MPRLNAFRFAFLISLFCSLIAPRLNPASEPTTRPLYNLAATQPAALDSATSLLMQALGDPNFAVRSRAGDQLLAMGTRSLVALGRAARSDDPEVRSRARALLRRMHWDEPADPPPVSAEMIHYGEFDIPTRRQIVRDLAWMQGPDSEAAWKALGRIMQNDPADDVLWEVVAQIRMHPNVILGLGPQNTETATGPIKALAARFAMQRNASLAITLFLAALEADKSADPPVRDRTEILFVVKDLLKLARQGRHEAQAAQLIREQYPLAAVNQRPWLNRELYSLHASAGPLAGFADDLRLRPPDLSDRPTLYAFASLVRRLGYARTADGIDALAFITGRLTAATQPAVAMSAQLASRIDVADFLIQQHWFDAAERELNEVLRLAPEDDVVHRVNAYFHFIPIAAARDDDFTRAEVLRKSLELTEKYPKPALRLGYESARLLPDDRQNLRATMHWFYFRAARKKGEQAGQLEHALALAGLKPVNDDLLLEVYPFLKKSGHDVQAQNLFDANYNQVRAQIARIGPEPGGLIRLARICVLCDQHLPESRQLAADALAQEPQNPRFIAVLAEAEFRLGHRDQAIRLQTEALKLLPNDKELETNLARYRRVVPSASSS